MKEIKERLANNSAKSIRASERFLREKYPQLSNSPLPTLTRKKPKDTQKRVLVIDDSIVIREMVCMNLKKAGYQVEKAWDGKHAWEILKGGLSYNLIFCDIKMPRMNGLEFLQRLQKNAFLSSIPVAMLTCCDNEDLKIIAAELGARAYQKKPYQVKDLLETAELLIRGKNLLTKENLAIAERKKSEKSQLLGI